MRFKGSSIKLVFFPYLDPISFLLVICFELPTILELFSISLEGSIELPGVDCTYSCKSRKDNRTKWWPLVRWLVHVKFSLFLEIGSRLAEKSVRCHF